MKSLYDCFVRIEDPIRDQGKRYWGTIKIRAKSSRIA
mgnify:CR=1 FL=1